MQDVGTENVVPIVVAALEVESKKLDAWLEKQDVTIKKGLLHKRALLGTARNQRKLVEAKEKK